MASTGEVTEETTETGPPRETEEKRYKCNHCGADVVPQKVQTKTGISNRCPECGKFMKVLTEEERRRLEEEARGPLPPIEVEMTERVKELLTEHLPRVYGIPKADASKRITAILDTLSPVVATDPWNLHNHIKNFAPNADDRHLESVITKIFAQLEAEGYRPGESRYQPRYAPRRRPGYQPRYTEDIYRRPPPYWHGYGQGYGEEYYPPPPPGAGRGEPMKVVIDGQEIITDFQGYMAWQKYAADKKKDKAEEETRKNKEKRDEEEHDMKMQKFQEEIKKLAGEGGGKPETMVDVKIGDQTVKVPASVAHLYLRGDSAEVKELRATVKDLTKTIEDKEKEETKKVLDDLSKKMDGMPGTVERTVERMAEHRGWGKPTVGRTTIDLLADLGGKADARAQQLINRMPGGPEFKPEVKRTPEERRAKAAEIGKRLEKTKEILKSEDELIKAAAKMG